MLSIIQTTQERKTNVELGTTYRQGISILGMDGYAFRRKARTQHYITHRYRTISHTTTIYAKAHNDKIRRVRPTEDHNNVTDWRFQETELHIVFQKSVVSNFFQ